MTRPHRILTGHPGAVILTGLSISGVYVLTVAHDTGNRVLAACAAVYLLLAVLDMVATDLIARQQATIGELRAALARARDVAVAPPGGDRVGYEIDVNLDFITDDDGLNGWRVPYGGLRHTPIGRFVSIEFAGARMAAMLPVVTHDPDGYPIVGITARPR